MARTIRVEPHVDVDEAERRMRSAGEPIERSHWQVVWLAMRMKSSREIVDTTGYGRDWVFKIIQRYNVDGPAGLGDARASNGAAPMLDHEALYELATALEGEPPSGGLWNWATTTKLPHRRRQLDLPT